MRAAVAAAPDLRVLVARRRAQEREPGVREVMPAVGRAVGLLGPVDAGSRRGRCPRGRVVGHHVHGPTTRAAEASRNADQRCDVGGIEDERHALVAIALAGRAQPARPAGPRRVEPSRATVPRSPGQRMTGRVRLDSGDQAELGDEAVVVGGELAVQPGREGVGRPARAPAAAAASSRHRALSANHGNAQAPTSCPAASAITWLFADEPRLRNAARYCWCQ